MTRLLNTKAMKAKKSLGQNFLNSPSALKKIILAGEIKPHDTILEIGPGTGKLTEALLNSQAKIVAVEKDQALVASLREKFANQLTTGQLQLIAGDIVDFLPQDKLPKNYKIIANIPYYLTGLIIKKFLSSNPPPQLMVLLLQQEVAERIVATKGKSSILSIAVGVYGQAKIIAKVSASCFQPQPKVDSAILQISQINQDYFSKNKISPENFFSLIKQGFGQKRKLLKNNLQLSTTDLDKLGITPQVRAEDLSTKQWLDLAKKILG